MVFEERLIALVSAAYATNALTGLIGYAPTLASLWLLYRAKQQALAVSIASYSLWSIGALNTALFGLIVAESWEMLFVGLTTLLFNLSVIALVLLIRANKPR